MSERQSWANQLRAALDEIERPYFQQIDGLRELLALQNSRGRRKTWRGLLGETTYSRWSLLSGLYGQIEWSMY